LIINMMRGRLNQPDAADGFMLDGFPRTVTQAKALDELMDDMLLALDAVVLLDVPDETVVSRLSSRRVCSSCGAIYNTKAYPTKTEGICDVCSGSVIQRDDDREDVIRNRLAVYHDKTAPLVEYYGGTGRLHRVGAAGASDAVREYLETLKGAR
jgi:adenylate kinase